MTRPVLIVARAALVLALAAAGIVALGAFDRPSPREVERQPGGVSAAARVALAAAGGAFADAYVERARRGWWCREKPARFVRSGPNKYALGSCRTAGAKRPPGASSLSLGRRLLPESSFASLIAEDTCAGASCGPNGGAGRADRWVLVGGRPGVRPRTTADCPRYRNIDFATDQPIAADRYLRVIPQGQQVRWRYASRGGGWVMAHWPGAGRYAWAFIPRSCVADPPAWSEIARWPRADEAAGLPRPIHGRPMRILREALPCPSRLRCTASR